MSAPLRTRHFPPSGPKPLNQLSRPQIAARAAITRDAIDTMVVQARMDGGEVPACLGAMKVTLYHLDERLRELDRQGR